MTVLFGALLLGMALVVIGVAIGARRVKRSAQRANEVVPGTPSRAPAAWAGAHTPEAKLHRRLRAVVDAAQAQDSTSGARTTEVARAVERGALELDERLIGAAALPQPHREVAIAAIEPSVVALENAVAGVTGSAGAAGQPELQAAVQDVQDRLAALAAARDEVDQLDVTRPRPRPAEGGSAPST